MVWCKELGYIVLRWLGILLGRLIYGGYDRSIIRRQGFMLVRKEKMVC